MGLSETKLLYICVVGLMGIVAGLWPILASPQLRYERYFSLGNAFGGGVFLGAALIHLLPDAIDSLNSLLGPSLQYPLASLICASGFLLVLLIEKVIIAEGEAGMVNAVNVRRYALAPYVLALVLSVHSIIAGIALGAESSAITSAALFIAIMAHKGVAGFALGVSLRRAHIVRPHAVGLIAFFATMTPLGIAVGAILGALLSGRGAEWFEGIFDALAAGTFLYIAVIDIVESEFAKQGDAGAKFAMVLLGIAVMALIAVWT
jgi:solute carrier family 39 (zinc transporter), member 1/2/3